MESESLLTHSPGRIPSRKTGPGAVVMQENELETLLQSLEL
jgi:hypothetical protein